MKYLVSTAMVMVVVCQTQNGCCPNAYVTPCANNQKCCEPCVTQQPATRIVYVTSPPAAAPSASDNKNNVTVDSNVKIDNQIRNENKIYVPINVQSTNINTFNDSAPEEREEEPRRPLVQEKPIQRVSYVYQPRMVPVPVPYPILQREPISGPQNCGPQCSNCRRVPYYPFVQCQGHSYCGGCGEGGFYKDYATYQRCRACF